MGYISSRLYTKIQQANKTGVEVKLDNITDSLDQLQDQIDALLDQVNGDPDVAFEPLLAECRQLVAELLSLYAVIHEKPVPADVDLLALFKAFVKGDPSLNAVRDNVRELVYYQNCLAEDRADALPKSPQKMAVRTTQHIYFYLRSRLEQEKLLD